MKRPIFTILSALSLLLCVLACLLWLRGVYGRELIWRRSSAHIRQVWTLDAHGMRYEILSDPFGRVIPFMGNGLADTPLGVAEDFKLDFPEGFDFLGAGAFHRGNFKDPAFPFHIRFFMVEYPAIVVITAFTPAAWLAFRFWRRRVRQKHLTSGMCLICGYNLCATPGRCPECGTVVMTAGEK